MTTPIINKTIDVLRGGGLVVAPSDTVYGLLVDATNDNAVQKLINFKNRPPGKPISVFFANFSMLNEQVKVNQKAKKILAELLPGPFTVILPSKHRLSSLLESEKGTLGIRIPKYPFITKLVTQFGKPITATSANLASHSPHYQISTLLKELPQSKRKLIDLIIDIGTLPRNKPSTIIDLTSPQLRILRQGDITVSRSQTFISERPSQTKRIAKFVLNKLIEKKINKPLLMIIEGELGVGKTVFVQGLAGELGIQNIVSPTFVVYYEYATNPSTALRASQLINKLIHVDLYNVEEPEEFRYLHLDTYLKKGNLLCIEWGEKTGEIIDLFKKKGKLVFVKMRYIIEGKREIIIEQ